jgi:hypothetical protein
MLQLMCITAAHVANAHSKVMHHSCSFFFYRIIATVIIQMRLFLLRSITVAHVSQHNGKVHFPAVRFQQLLLYQTQDR